MLFNTFGNPSHKTLMLIHGLGVSYQVFNPLIEHLQSHYRIIAVQVDGFLIDEKDKAIPSVFTSIDDQVDQLVQHILTTYQRNGEVFRLLNNIKSFLCLLFFDKTVLLLHR